MRTGTPTFMTSSRIQNHPGTYRQSYLNFAPRIDLRTRQIQTLRFMVAMALLQPFQYNQLQFLMQNAPNFYLQQNTYALATLTPVASTFVANPTLMCPAPFTISPNLPIPVVQQRNLAVQHSFGHGWIFSLAYLGNTSSHLQIRQNPNQATPPVNPQIPTPLQSRRPYSWVGDVFQISTISRGNYNALGRP